MKKKKSKKKPPYRIKEARERKSPYKEMWDGETKEDLYVFGKAFGLRDKRYD